MGLDAFLLNKKYIDIYRNIDIFFFSIKQILDNLN